MIDKQTFTALIIEPDRASRDLIALAIRRLNGQVFTAAEYPQALALYKEHHPQLLFLASVLPQMNGMELLKDLKALGLLRQTHVIMVSALGYREIITQALEAGADDFIVKPIDPGVIEEKVTLWKNRLSEKQP
jgi:DNA-binding response OmpR family regulator